jgi:hypothetical protein
MAIKRNIDEDAYSFYKYRETEEIHIYKGKFTSDTECNANRISICGKVNKVTEDTVRVISCLNEEEARRKAAEIGRTVCGGCVSHLYSSY